MEKCQVDIKKKGTYYIIDSCTSAKTLCIAFHGYAQLAEYFIKNFQAISTSSIIIAPEGTNYFYYGKKKRVVANWMSSLFREQDIESNNTFINTLFDKVQKRYPTIDTINVLGFSQGVATALRWLTQRNILLNKLVLWAGKLPVDYFSIPHIKTKECYFVSGDEDEFKDDFYQSKKKLKERYGSSFKNIVFSGGHTMNQDVILKVFKSKLL